MYWSHPDPGIGGWGQIAETGIGCVRCDAEQGEFVAVQSFRRRGLTQEFSQQNLMLGILIGRNEDDAHRRVSNIVSG